MTTTLTVGVNTYISLEEAEAYFSGRVNSATWDGVEDKAKLLITATNMLESFDWAGNVMSDDQELAFPRSGSYYEPQLKKSIPLESNRAKRRLLSAVCEVALSLIDSDPFVSEGTVASITVGPISLSGMKSGGTSAISSAVSEVVKPLLVESSTGNRWWRAN